MHNQTSDSKQNTAPTQHVPRTITSDTCLIACPIFAKELESILAELNIAPVINYMHYTIHTNPLMMEEQLQEKITAIQGKTKNIRFLVGRHCKGKREMVEVVESCKGKIPQAKNCIEMLIGNELSKDLEKNRTSLMTPAWVRMITQSIADGQWSVPEARLNLGWYNKILILDTGVDSLSDEQIMEFFDLTQVEIDILPVDLKHFKTVLQDLLQ
jgi:hypothetical protein